MMNRAIATWSVLCFVLMHFAPICAQGSLAQFVFDVTHDDGIEAGMEMLDKYLEDTRFEVVQRDFYNSGHVLCQRDRVEEGLQLLERLKEVFPRLDSSIALLLFQKANEPTSVKLKDLIDVHNSDQRYYKDRSELRISGAALLAMGKLEEAKVISNLNVETYPDNDDVYEDLGDVLYALGDSIGATAAFRKKIARIPNNNFFKLAAEPSMTYEPTQLPNDTTALFEYEGDMDRDVAFVFVQGGPMPDMRVYGDDPMLAFPNAESLLRIHTKQSQMLSPKLLASEPVLTDAQALYEHNLNAEILHRTVSYLKDRGKTVHVIGHSYGCFISLEYLYTKENVADKVVLMGGDLDENLENYTEKGDMNFIRWRDGVDPYEVSAFGDSPLVQTFQKDLGRVFVNTKQFVRVHGVRRYVQLLRDKDLSNVIFIHSKFDEANARSRPYELEFLRSRGARVVESYGDHHNMLYSRAAMTNLYYVLTEDRILKKSGTSRLSDAIEKYGVEEALEIYKFIQNSNYYHPIDEGEMNALGYRLLQQEKVKEAIEVFKINVSAFPDHWNVHDSLGEAYMTNDDKDLAIKHYERSVEIYPGNIYGIRALKELMK